MGQFALALAGKQEGAGHQLYFGEPISRPSLETIVQALELIARVDPVRSRRFRRDAPHVLIAPSAPTQYWWRTRTAVINVRLVTPSKPLDTVFVLVELSVFARLQRKFGARLGVANTQRLWIDGLRAQAAFAERLVNRGEQAAETHLVVYRQKLASMLASSGARS
jgi:hypothetical protein